MSDTERQRDSFIFYRNWWESLKTTPEIRHEVLDAVMSKVFDGKTLSVSPLAQMALSFILPAIERDVHKYDEIVEKRRQAGRMGGLKTQANAKQNKQMVANTSKAKQIKQVQANQADNVNVSLLMRDKSSNEDNINIDVVDVNTRMREENFIDSKINSWHNADIVTHDNIPDLTAKWIEEIQLLVRRFNQKELTTDEVYSYYEDFKAQEATETLQTTYSDWRKHFGNFIRKRIKRQEDERDSKADKDYNSPEARAKRQEGYARVMQKLIAEGQQPKKDDKLPF